MDIWETLGIEPTRDVRAIKRAYAMRARERHPEEDPEAFRALHEAYREALARAARPGGGARCAAEAFPDVGEDVSEETEGPEDAEPSSPPPWEPDMELERLIARGLRQKERADRERRASVLAEMTALADGPDGGNLEKWRTILSSTDFEQIQHDPQFLPVLEAFFLSHKRLPAAVWAAFYSAYHFSRLERLSDRGPYEGLFEILAPRRRRHLSDLEEARRARFRRRLLLGLGLAPAPLYLYLLARLGLLWAVPPALVLIAFRFALDRWHLRERFLRMGRWKRPLVGASGAAATALLLRLLALTGPWGWEAPLMFGVVIAVGVLGIVSGMCILFSFVLLIGGK